MANFYELWTKIKAPLIAIVNTIIAFYAPVDMQTMLTTIVNSVFVIADAIIQYLSNKQKNEAKKNE